MNTEGRPPLQPIPRGRGTGGNPPNRFNPIHVEWDPQGLEEQGLESAAAPRVPTQCFEDNSRSVLTRNDSPDVNFDYSLNPYRGCEHGCIYCYARPTHEYLGFSAGLDFESRIMVKRDAPALLAKALAAPSWKPQVIGFSGNTDCYQPVEKHFRLARRCLAVMLEFGNPVEIVTKGALILRDLDVLREMAHRNLVRVTISVTTLDAGLALAMEPRAAAPARRLEVIGRLAQQGVPTRVNVAPVIPGLNDHEVPNILEEAAAHGAADANYIMLRLPLAVEALFQDWLRLTYPDRAEKVIHAIREVRGGGLSDARFGVRMRGEGVRADAIADMFGIHCRKLGLNRECRALSITGFRRRGPPQQSLF